MYDDLFDYALSDANPGYKRDVVEIPNGDGKPDWGKRYGHINARYGFGPCEDLYHLYMGSARFLCEHYGLSEPGEESTLRFLEYPPGVGGNPHTDFNLLTINVWRSHYIGQPSHHLGEFSGMPALEHSVPAMDETQRAIVFFAVPELVGEVGERMAERMKRSRL